MHLFIDVLEAEAVKGAESDDERKEAIEIILANDLAQVDSEALPAHFEQTDLENALTSYSGELAKTLGKHYASREEVRGVDFSRLAETLIMLESLKEKVTRPTESVGGPIDVCVISKSDGFVWIKRRHYFDPKLNPQYFLRQGAKFE